MGREVRITALGPSDVISAAMDLSRSLVMLVLGRDVSVALDKMLRQLMAEEPLAVVFFGVNASRLFDAAIELQGELDGRHIMTKLSYSGDLSEAIEDFLQATWPSDDRFDEWHRYSILIMGDGWSVDEVCAAAETITS